MFNYSVIGRKIVKVETSGFPDEDYGDEDTGLVEDKIRLIFDDGSVLEIVPLETNSDWALRAYHINRKDQNM